MFVNPFVSIFLAKKCHDILTFYVENQNFSLDSQVLRFLLGEMPKPLSPLLIVKIQVFILNPNGYIHKLISQEHVKNPNYES
jgi:hypothetical protein